MIQFSEVSKYYENEFAVKDVSFAVEKGEMVFITGPSGAGKTTILKLIYRSERPDEGKVTVAGWDVGELRQSTIPYLRKNVGIVFQDFRLLLNRTVFDNIALALRIRGVHPKEIKASVTQVLKDVGLKLRAHDFPQHLSGGEQQRVVIARAMVSKPTVLLADEPTGNLDPDTSSIVMNLFKEINARGTTVLIATHQKELYTGTGRRVLRIKEGELAEDSSV
ncbi:MAG TPA: cell division ATP-binding protein FtsE [Nitrospirae bacterium]|nr:cell division ATP-binding protein FtsE [Nitrospirota bacterium]